MNPLIVQNIATVKFSLNPSSIHWITLAAMAQEQLQAVDALITLFNIT